MRIGTALLGLATCGLAACGGPRRAAPAVRLAPATHVAAPAVPAFEPAGAGDEPREVQVEPLPRYQREGDLSDRELARVLRAHEPGLRHCFLAAVRVDPGLGMIKARLHLRFGARGRVQVAEASAGETSLDACLVAVLRRMRVPAPGAPVDVHLPMFFSP
jgi:hypothetical protein